MASLVIIGILPASFPLSLGIYVKDSAVPPLGPELVQRPARAAKHVLAERAEHVEVEARAAMIGRTCRESRATVGHAGLGVLVSLHGGGRVTVVHDEVVDEHRDGEPDHEHAGDTGDGAHQVTPRRHWRHVAVAHGCHGDHRPPETLWDVREILLRMPLGEVDE